jgi:hypothetical protein
MALSLAGSTNDELELRTGGNRGSRRLPRRCPADGGLVRAERARPDHGLPGPRRGRSRAGRAAAALRRRVRNAREDAAAAYRDREPSPAEDDRVDRNAQPLGRRRRRQRARNCRDLHRLLLRAYGRTDLGADPRFDPRRCRREPFGQGRRLAAFGRSGSRGTGARRARARQHRFARRRGGDGLWNEGHRLEREPDPRNARNRSARNLSPRRNCSGDPTS